MFELLGIEIKYDDGIYKRIIKEEKIILLENKLIIEVLVN